jgi:hypothetical protein
VYLNSNNYNGRLRHTINNTAAGRAKIAALRDQVANAPMSGSSGGGRGGGAQKERYSDAFVRKWDERATQLNNWITSDSVVNAVAGFGDSLSFNLTKHFRNWHDIGNVDTKSEMYGYGNTSGTVFGLVNAGRAALQIYKGVNKAKQWRSNSKTSRRTRARKIAAAGSYRPTGGDAALTLIGGSGVDSYMSFLTDKD